MDTPFEKWWKEYWAAHDLPATQHHTLRDVAQDAWLQALGETMKHVLDHSMWVPWPKHLDRS